MKVEMILEAKIFKISILIGKNMVVDELSFAQINNLLVRALEGDIKHWYIGLGIGFIRTSKDRYIDGGFLKKGWINILKHDNKEYLFEVETLKNGIGRFRIENEGKHFENVMKGKQDELTGDLFLQCCCRGIETNE